MNKMALGVNIDHVATLRQARGGVQPDLVAAALEAIQGGADSITVHLREDRRHIQDRDLPALQKHCRVPLNLEMALNEQIVKIALTLKPEKVCIVPEKRRELTTEGGLDVLANKRRLSRIIPQLQKKKIEVSLFIAPDPFQIALSRKLGADAIEIHTGAYANARGAIQAKELVKIRMAAKLGHQLGLKVHAGHGLDCQNVKPILKIPEIRELNIGHSLVSRAIFTGLRRSVAEMKQIITRR